jgi:hypothetical protein
MLGDQIVEEVRRIREELARQCDFDVATIFANLRARQKTVGNRLVRGRPERMAEPEHPAGTEKAPCRWCTSFDVIGDEEDEMMQRGSVRTRTIWFAFVSWSMTLCTVLAQDKPCYPPTHSPVPNILELTYHEARKKLLASAWQPLRTKPYTATANEDPDIGSGNGPLLWEKGYYELEFCSGTGSAMCAFLFRDVYGNRLEVITEGEELPKDTAHAIVSRFSFVCNSEWRLWWKYARDSYEAPRPWNRPLVYWVLYK